MCLINSVFKPQYWTFALQIAANFFLFNVGFKRYGSKYQAQQNSRNRSNY